MYRKRRIEDLAEVESTKQEEKQTPPNAPLRLPAEPEEESQPAEMITISQSTLFYFLTAVMFFVAGLIVGWVGYSSSVNGVINENKNIVSTVQSLVSSIAANGGQQVAIQPTKTPVPR